MKQESRSFVTRDDFANKDRDLGGSRIIEGVIEWYCESMVSDPELGHWEPLPGNVRTFAACGRGCGGVYSGHEFREWSAGGVKLENFA